MVKIDAITKNEFEKKLKTFERKISSQIPREVNLKFNEVKKEESLLEKKRIDKQTKKDEQEWSIIKNPEERLLGIEQKISSMGEYLEKITKQFNEFMDSFNKHVDKNNDDFQVITNALRGEKVENTQNI